MDEYQMIGYVITTVITLGGFIGVILKFTQPINDLRLAIQKLSDSIDTMRLSADRHERTLEDHENRIVDMNGRLGTLETKISIYHEKEGV